MLLLQRLKARAGDYCTSQSVGWCRVGVSSPTLSTFHLLLFFHLLLLAYWVTRGLWKIWLSDAWRSWTQTSRTAGRCVMTVEISTLRPPNRTAVELWTVDPQTPRRFIIIRPSLTLEGPYRGTLRRLEHFILVSRFDTLYLTPVYMCIGSLHTSHQFVMIFIYLLIPCWKKKSPALDDLLGLVSLSMVKLVFWVVLEKFWALFSAS